MAAAAMATTTRRCAAVVQATVKRGASSSSGRSHGTEVPPPESFEGVTVDDVKKEFSALDGASSGTGSVVLSQSGRIAKIEFGNPQSRNAFNARMMCQLHDAALELERWVASGQCSGVLLVSRGKGIEGQGRGQGSQAVFCSGGDLNTVRRILGREGGWKMATLMQDSLGRIRRLPVPSATLVNGRAIGGGAELVTATDFRVFWPDATVAFVQSKLGISPGWGGVSRLVGLVGRSQALSLLLSGRQVGAEEAKAMGLCDHILERGDGGGEDEAEKWFVDNFVARNDPESVSGIKRIVDLAADLSPEDPLVLREEKAMFSGLWGSPAHRAALDGSLKKK